MNGTQDRDFAAVVEEAIAHHRAGRSAQAEAGYRAALELAPGNPSVLHNLGVAVAQQGRARDAVAIFDCLIAAEPHYASAHFNRANALQAGGDAAEAIRAYRTVLALEPDHIATHRALGFLWLAQGDRDRSMDHFARTYELRRGEERIGISARSLSTATREKLLHDAALFRHIPPRARDGKRFEMMARVYERVAADFPEEPADLTEAQLEMLGDSYNGPIHIRAAPEARDGAVNPHLDAAAIEADFRDTPPGVAWFDGLLTDDALARLRRFLLESTIWHDFTHIPGFVASYLEDGLACPLILQIADEFRAVLPGLLGPHPLTQAWAFKGLRETEPIDIHADDAAISLNFWVTPDSANRDPAHGGLVVYREPPPPDWELGDYDSDRARIRAFLAGQEDRRTIVPYGENRAVLFDSRLFHGSDSPDFSSGYENRRINITMLFGEAKKL